MNPIGLEWGVRIRCCHIDCKRTIATWSSVGVPSQPWAGLHGGGELKGWFIHYLKHRAELGSGPSRHVSFCPEHTAAAIAWIAARDQWCSDRYRVGREHAVTLGLTLKERISGSVTLDAVARDKLERKVGELVWAWVKENPAPRPPWSKT